MRTEMFFPKPVWEDMRESLLRNTSLEAGGFLYCGSMTSDNLVRLLVREFVPFQPGDYLSQSGGYLRVKPEKMAERFEKAYQQGFSIVEVHTHPFSHLGVTFSGVDLRAESQSFPYVARKIPEIYHATLVLGQASVDAHLWQRENETVRPIDQLKIIDSPLKIMKTTSGNLQETVIDWSRFSRQVSAFGKKGQKQLSELCFGFAGTGGLSFLVATYLAYLGVKTFVLVDPDLLDRTNLNRLLGATPYDIGRPKVEVLADWLSKINPSVQVKTSREKIGQDKEALKCLRSVDILVGGLDNFGARSILNSFAVQYLVPLFDCGFGIKVEKEQKLSAVVGQVVLVLPGSGFCLECINFIDKEKVALDFLSEKERGLWIKRGYIDEVDIEAPSVIFLNGAIASLAVQEIYNLITNFKIADPYVHFDGLANQLTLSSPRRNPNCVTCADSYGRLGQGDNLPLPSLAIAGKGKEPPSFVEQKERQSSRDPVQISFIKDHALPSSLVASPKEKSHNLKAADTETSKARPKPARCKIFRGFFKNTFTRKKGRNKNG